MVVNEHAEVRHDAFAFGRSAFACVGAGGLTGQSLIAAGCVVIPPCLNGAKRDIKSPPASRAFARPAKSNRGRCSPTTASVVQTTRRESSCVPTVFCVPAGCILAQSRGRAGASRPRSPVRFVHSSAAPTAPPQGSSLSAYGSKASAPSACRPPHPRSGRAQTTHPHKSSRIKPLGDEAASGIDGLGFKLSGVSLAGLRVHSG